MRLYGLLERLTKIVLTNGKDIEITPATQTGASAKIVRIPDMADKPDQSFVLTTQAQELENKTIDFSKNTVSNIVDANVKSDAAIAGTKISPNFGSQNVQTTGNITTGGNLTANGAGSKLIVDVSTASEAVYIRQLGAGNALVVLDQDEGAGVDSSATFINASGNVGIGLAANATLTEKVEVSGNIKTSGNVLAAPGKGLESSASGALNVGTSVSTTALYLGSGDSVATLEIGTGAASKTIKIGKAGDVVDLNGSSLALGATNALTIGDSNDTVTVPGTISAGNMTVTGNLTVQGTTTTVDTTNLLVKDKNITVNNGGTTAGAEGAGLSVEGDADAIIASVKYDSALASKWKLGVEGAEKEVADVSSSQNLLNKVVSSTAALTGALKLPVGLGSERPGTPAEGMIRYNSETDSFEGYAAGAWAGIGGSGTVDKITQAYVAPETAFAIGEVLYLDGSTYKRAIASAANTAEVVGVVSRIIDATPATFTFELTLSGEISGLTGLVAGEVYFLSATTAGLLTVTEPSVVGHVSLPVGVASSTTTLYVAPKRGVVVGAANARTTISVANNAATNVVDVTSYNSLKLEGELNVTRSSGGNQRAYYTVEAAKNGAGVWQVSASYTGDDVLYTTLPSWDVASNNLQVTMPLVTNFTSASLTYALNAPAVGASLPLSIDSSALNIVADAPLSYRNRIINGDMRIDQRNSGAAVTITTTTGLTYVVDRFYGYCSAASKFSLQRNAGAITPPAGFTNYLGATSLSAYTPGSSEEFNMGQPVEGFNVADLAWGTASAQAITISFWARSSLTGTFSGAIRNNATNRSYVFSYTISAANTWEQKTIVVPGDTSGTWLADNSVGLYLSWSLGAGATKSTAAGSWGAGSFVHATGAQSVVGTNGATFYLTGVQLEVGSKASAFERRPYSEELARCMRYYERWQAGDPYAFFLVGAGSSPTTVALAYPFKVSKRTSNYVLSSGGNFMNLAGSGTISGFFVQGDGKSTETGALSAGGTGFTTGSVYFLRANNSTAAFVAFDAEL